MFFREKKNVISRNHNLPDLSMIVIVSEFNDMDNLSAFFGVLSSCRVLSGCLVESFYAKRITTRGSPLVSHHHLRSNSIECSM